MAEEILDRSCSTCGETKPLTEFYPRLDRPLGREYVCKACRRKSAKAYREANPEKVRLAKAAAKAKDPERYRRLTRESAARRREHKAPDHWAAWIKKSYGMSAKEYTGLFEKQKGRCAICRNITKYRLCVDHDHETGLVRGLLCKPCNSSLGGFKDNADLLQKALAYLQFYNKPLVSDNCEETQSVH